MTPAAPYKPKTPRVQRLVARFSALRDRGLPLAEAARLMDISERTAQRYETARKARTS